MATTVADLYAQTLGRSPDAAGLAYWEKMFGPTVDPTEAATFLSVAKVTEPKQVAAVQQQTFNPFTSSIDPTALKAVQKIDTSGPQYEAYTVGAGQDGEMTLYRPVNNLPDSTYGALYGGPEGETVTGYFSTNEMVNGIPVTTYYDAQGNLEKYVGGATQNLSDSVRLSAEWDPTGKAAPVQWNTDNGLFNSGITFDDAVRTAIMVAAATAGGTPEAGAAEAGGSEAVSGIDLGGVGASPNTWMGGGTYGTVPAAISSTVPAGTNEPLSGIDLGGPGASPNTWMGNGVTGVVPTAGSITAAQVIKALPLVPIANQLLGDPLDLNKQPTSGPTGPTGFDIVPMPDTWKPPIYDNGGTGGTNGTGAVGGIGGANSGMSGTGGLDLNSIFTNQNLLTGTQWQGLPSQRNLTFNDIFAAGQQSTPMGTPVNLNNIVSAILGQNATSQKSA